MSSSESGSATPAGDPEFPTADVRTARHPIGRVLGQSRMWLLTAVCLVLAIGLALSSLPTHGPEITINFTQGHGLQSGNSLRHRGIEVGRVTSVELTRNLDSVDVCVVLNESAARLARENSRFWIVRPQVSLSGVSGLETAVGAKYVAVSPGDPNGRVRTRFVGLNVPPADGLDRQGIEIVLRGDKRYGLSPGSPVTYRGVEVGRVLSVQLSVDALSVDARAQVDAAYRRLLRSHSKFWVTSGVDLDVGLTGIHMNAESLATVARGGVAFVTPDDETSNEQAAPVEPGRVFRLHAELEQDWLDSAAGIGLIDVNVLPSTVRLAADWQQKRFGFADRIDVRRHGSALVVEVPDGLALIAPASLLVRPGAAIDDSFRVAMIGNRQEGVPLDAALVADAPTRSLGPLRVILLTESDLPVQAASRTVLRVPDEPEDAIVVRRQPGGGNSAPMLMNIAGNIWHVDAIDASPDIWLGAPVLAVRDMKVIGLLDSSGRSAAAIVPITHSHIRELTGK